MFNCSISRIILSSRRYIAWRFLKIFPAVSMNPTNGDESILSSTSFVPLDFFSFFIQKFSVK